MQNGITTAAFGSGMWTSGTITSTADVRAPIFYDSDTTYYLDLNSTSDSALRIRGGALFGPNTTWGASLYVGGNGRVGTSATVAVTNGNLHMDSQDGYQMYLNYYSGAPVWTGGNLGVGSPSASYRLHVHGTGFATSDFRSPEFRFTNSGNSAYMTGDAGWGARIQTDSGYILFGPANGSYAHIYTDRGNFYFNKDILINGTQVVVNSGTWNITATGNVASRAQSNWNDNTVINNVVGLLSWKNYGNNHVIFDASQGTSPSGGGVSQTNATVAWSASYPTLMGWNGTSTYGVRVDSARVADSATLAPAYLPLAGGTLTGPLTIGTTVNSVIWNDGTGTYMENTGNSAATRVIRLQAHNGSFSYTQLFVNGGGGYVEVNNQMRAPIYYDSQDTAYYLDPNSTSISLSSNGIVSSGVGTSGGFQNRVYTSGRNRIWSFGNADGYGISYFQGGPDYIGLHASGSPTQAGSDFWVSSTGIAQASGSMRAPIFYDSNDTAYYVDPNSESNLYRFTAASMTRNAINYLSINSPFTTRAAQTRPYQNGTMGWGTVDFNAVFSNWGSGFIDTWSSPANAPGGSSHYVGFNAMHYNFENNSQGYGFQMACAGEAVNRYFWRNGWPNLNGWVEMLHSGNYTSFAAQVNGNVSNTFSVYQLSYESTNFNPSAAPRTTMNPMSIKMWNNYFNGTGLGSDYGTVMQYYSLGGHVDSQVYFDAGGGSWYRTAAYASGFGAWQHYLTSSNYTNYAPSLTGGGASGTWGINVTGNAATATGQQSSVNFTINTGGAGYGLVGVYNPAVHQGLFAMGAAYTLSAGGGLANFYGVSWTYDAAGYAINTGYNLAHCMAVANAGTVYTVIGVGIWTSGLIRANGAISSGSTITATGFFESSDSRLKELIQDDYRAVGIQNIKPKLYIKNGKEEIGYFAQDFQSVLSSAVTENNEGFLNLSYTQVHTVKIAHLEDSVEEIKAKILYLENQLKQKQ
jgi:hypothetical protein